MQTANAVPGTGVDENKKIEEMENGILEYLRLNEDVVIANHNRPGDSFAPFTKFILRMTASATGTTYELLTSDYEGINYSNLRGIRNDFAKSNKEKDLFVFDQGLSGTLMLCNRNEALPEFYEPGKEFVEYDDISDCLEKIQYYQC